MTNTRVPPPFPSYSYTMMYRQHRATGLVRHVPGEVRGAFPSLRADLALVSGGIQAGSRLRWLAQRFRFPRACSTAARTCVERRGPSAIAKRGTSLVSSRRASSWRASRASALGCGVRARRTRDVKVGAVCWTGTPPRMPPGPRRTYRDTKTGSSRRLPQRMFPAASSPKQRGQTADACGARPRAPTPARR
jgi:hypothetical protein